MPAASGLNKSVFTAKAQKGFQRKGRKDAKDAKYSVAERMVRINPVSSCFVFQNPGEGV
jgi:hypothetical protein